MHLDPCLETTECKEREREREREREGERESVLGWAFKDVTLGLM